jgi:Putative zinc-finger
MTEDRYRDWDASYVLGALPAGERLEYERHLETCPACRAAVAELAGMPGILGRVPAEDVLAIGALPDDAALRDAQHTPRTLPATARALRRSRSRRRLLAGVAAGLLLVAGLAGGFAVGANTGGPAVAAESPMTPSGSPDVSAELAVTATSWGTRFDWNCRYLGGDASPAEHEDYSLVVTTMAGAEKTVATWDGSSGAATDLAAASGISRSSIARVDIRVTGTDVPLVVSRL